MDRKIILWSLVLFFGCSILFRAIDAVASSGGKGMSVAIQALVAAALIGTIVLVWRMKR
ncbi:MAG TPA: hypothetical protein VGO80_17170 [Solirubrobacteraceae bacterium]|nr:hypothetical protein [Solirubrobacteraceae bacterium]